MDEHVARLEVIEGQIRAACEGLTAVMCAMPPPAAARAATILEACRTVAVEEDMNVDISERAGVARDATMAAFVRLLTARARSAP